MFVFLIFSVGVELLFVDVFMVEGDLWMVWIFCSICVGVENVGDGIVFGIEGLIGSLMFKFINGLFVMVLLFLYDFELLLFDW